MGKKKSRECSGGASASKTPPESLPCSAHTAQAALGKAHLQQAMGSWLLGFAFCCTFVLDKTADASTNCLFPCCGDGMEQCTLLVLHRGSRPCNRDRSSGRAARAGAQPTSKLQKLGSTFTADPCKARYQPCWAKTCCLHDSC